MNRLTKSLKDLEANLANIPYLVTRFDKKVDRKPKDLDILVHESDLDKVVSALTRAGYKASSHDKAWGGRRKGAQVNLTSTGAIKIDLHKDFTWRGKKYIDHEFLWTEKVFAAIDGVKITAPQESKDAFLVVINILFEKEYVTKGDWEYLQRTFSPSRTLSKQAEKFGWSESFRLFVKWWEKQNPDNFPHFLPIWLVIVSYWEKFNAVSFMYYIFFRSRFSLSGRLPYE